MAVDIDSALSRAYEELRTIDMDLSSLSGIPDRYNRKRIGTGDSVAPTSASSERRILDGGRRIIVGPVGSAKRSRYEDEYAGDHRHQNQQQQRDYSPPPQRSQRTLSSVVMAASAGATTIETKSRTAVISEKKKNESKEDAVRNRRLFSNLLVSTLRQFQKEEKTVGSKGLAQIEKQREVERRLEENEKENRERMLRERDQLMTKRRDKEMEIRALRRQKAIEQSAEEKMRHFQRLACFIQTQTKPPLFFLPAKHTLRTLELLKDSSKKIDTLIGMRREEMDRELKRLEVFTGGSALAREDDDEESDHEYNELNTTGALKSTVVVKTEKQLFDEEEEEQNKNGGVGASAVAVTVSSAPPRESDKKRNVRLVGGNPDGGVEEEEEEEEEEEVAADDGGDHDDSVEGRVGGN